MASELVQERCPLCGGSLVRKNVEKLLRGGVHTAVVRAMADVCQRCGERLYSTDDVRRFETIRDKLARQDTADLVPLGRSFEAV